MPSFIEVANHVVSRVFEVLGEIVRVLIDPMTAMKLTHMDIFLSLLYLFVTVWFIKKIIWPLNFNLALGMMFAVTLGQVFLVDFFQKHNMDVLHHSEVVAWCESGQHITSKFPLASELCSAERYLANTTKWMGAKIYIVSIGNMFWFELIKRWATDSYLKFFFPFVFLAGALLWSRHNLRVKEITIQSDMITTISSTIISDRERLMESGRQALENSRELQHRLLCNRASVVELAEGSSMASGSVSED